MNILAQELKSIEDLRLFLKKRYPQAKIYLFGSRAKGGARKRSDIDIAIEGLDEKELAMLRYVLEESHLPWRVDLVDLSKATYLVQVIEKEGTRWQ